MHCRLLWICLEVSGKCIKYEIWNVLIVLWYLWLIRKRCCWIKFTVSCRWILGCSVGMPLFIMTPGPVRGDQEMRGLDRPLFCSLAGEPVHSLLCFVGRILHWRLPSPEPDGAVKHRCDVSSWTIRGWQDNLTIPCHNKHACVSTSWTWLRHGRDRPDRGWY